MSCFVMSRIQKEINFVSQVLVSRLSLQYFNSSSCCTSVLFPVSQCLQSLSIWNLSKRQKAKSCSNLKSKLQWIADSGGLYLRRDSDFRWTAMIPNDFHSFCFSSWYPRFRHVTFPSEIVPLEDAVVAFLREDGMQLPAGIDSHASDSSNYASGGQENESSQDWGSSDDDDEQEVHPWVTSLKAKVEKAITKLGGQVFPKLNFTSPRDASWILPNRQLKCTSLTDVLLLLKASSLVQYDLSDSIRERGFIQYELVLRRWMEFSPGWEYRCFVKDNRLIGISQRNCSDFYAHNLVDFEGLTLRIRTFFERFIQKKFTLSDYVFDIVTFGTSVEDYRLVDFNPFDKVTDPGLFAWEELLSAGAVPTDQLLRVIREPTAVQPSEMRQYEIPADFTNSGFSTNGRNLFEYLQDRRTTEPETDSDDET